ncbi:DNA-binding GntR family transcriptional regulator [Devosia sp. 2618]
MGKTGPRPPVAEDDTAPMPMLSRPSGLGDEVYEVLLSQLVSLRIPPGSRITVDALARSLGVSQTPIRQALHQLESEGLVVKAHLIGYSATPQLSFAQFNELFELRLLLEPALAGMAARNMSDDAIEDLAGMVSGMAGKNAAESRIGYSRFAKKDEEFHERIAAGSGNNLIKDVLSRLHVHIHLFRLKFHSQVTEEAVDEHATIIEAIRRRDANAAEAAMRTHIGTSRNRLKDFFEDQ